MSYAKRNLLVCAFLSVLCVPTQLWAEKFPESKDKADHVVTAKVEAVYTRTRTLDADTPFETKRIEYVIELDVLEVHRGNEAKAGKRFYIHCFKRDDSALPPGATPPPGMGGHREIPKEGQTIKAYARYAHGTNNGLYPRWFDVVEEKAPTESAAPADRASAILIDMDGVKHRLTQVEADFLVKVVSAQPDVDTAAHITLDPPYRVIVDGDDRALEPDELFLMHRGGTKTWKSSGVRARILPAAGIK